MTPVHVYVVEHPPLGGATTLRRRQNRCTHRTPMGTLKKVYVVARRRCGYDVPGFGWCGMTSWLTWECCNASLLGSHGETAPIMRVAFIAAHASGSAIGS